jgi:hypothetical protein
VTIDHSPRPRILFVNASDRDFDLLSQLAPTNSRILPGETFHATDWDLIVAFGEYIPEIGPYHVLSFGGTAVESVFAKTNKRYWLTFDAETKARSTYVAAECPPALRSLVQSSLIDAAPEGIGQSRAVWDLQEVDPFGNHSSWKALEVASAVTPLVQIGDEGNVQSFISTRVSPRFPDSHLWMLPALVEPLSWLTQMLEIMSKEEPERFPVTDEWRLSPEWSPEPLQLALGARSELEAERKRILADLDSKAVLAEELIVREAAAAASGAQALLTEDGEPLVEAVAKALESIGFRVQNMDGHHDAVTGAKLEDLRVFDDSDPDWTALAEVKGYLKGAKVSDVAQIAGRPSSAYAMETGHTASTIWHIVNHWRERPPAQRPKAIGNDKIDLKPLTDAAGCLIETRDLFRAAAKASENNEARSRVRTQLKATIGRFEFPTQAKFIPISK